MVLRGVPFITKRSRLILQKESNDEETESNDLNQFKMASNKFEVDIVCDSIRNDANLSRF